jgi:L-seryl-tRNA(Ser) seleniumtransferase
MTDARRALPSVDSLLRTEPAKRAAATFGRALLKRTITAVLDDARHRASRAKAGPPERPSENEILARAIGLASRISVGLTPVINATGVILHTNLGRAPVPERAVRAAAEAARGYSDLEVDRDTGARGRRTARVETMLVALTGAEDALVVNNCAAALMLSLAALAKGKQVLVSRGELIEIGGEFRIPDIMSAAGTRLVEVGTTNRTRIGDYRAAFGDRVAAVLKVHPSNYRVVGFTASASAADLARLARKHDVPFVYDVGSGLLRRGHGMPPDEPAVADALADGADLVTFSGDKLLGGPQSGIVVGRAELVSKLRRHPMARAVRVDKMQIAVLGQVLSMLLTGADEEIPVGRMLREPAGTVRRRAQLLSETVGGDLEHVHVHRCESVVGGGSMPGTGVPSWGVRVSVPDPSAFSARLRTGRPSVFGRVERDHVLLDLRTVTDEQVPDLARAIWYALEGDDVDDGD